MTNIFQNGYISDIERTEGEVQTALEDLRSFLTEKPGGNAISTLTISGGEITPTRAVHRVDTESAAASDDLDRATLTNLSDGSLLLICSANSTRKPTVRHAQGGNGQFLLGDGANFLLDSTTNWLLLVRDGTAWREIARSYGESKANFRTWLGLGTAAAVNTGTGSGDVPTKTQADGLYAALAGNTSQVFSCGNASAGTHAVNRTTGDGRYAALAGSGSQTFSVANASNSAHAVNLGQADARYEPLGGSSGGVPSGMMLVWPFGESTIPGGWVKCDGSTQTINSESVEIPDMRGYFLMGASESSPAPSNGGFTNNITPGSAAGSVNHTHIQQGTFGTGTPSQNFNTNNNPVAGQCGSNAHTHSVSISGPTQSTNSAPRYKAYTWIIKVDEA